MSSWIIQNRRPCPQLRAYITEYSYRQVKTGKGMDFLQAMPLWPQSTIDFILSGRINTFELASGKELPFSNCIVRGLRRSRTNYIRINGDFTIFICRLTPAGLYGLLNIPASEFNDHLVDLRLIHNSRFRNITEQLMACNNADECVSVIEPFFMDLLRLHDKNSLSPAVRHMTGIITSLNVPPSVKKMQQDISLSVRQLERNFLREIGVSPKYFSRMVRFTNMLYFKMKFPETRWPALAYEFNYTDQMHLIHDFQHFLKINPQEFKREDFAGFEIIPPTLIWDAY